jgi:uncharacterized protein (TIGR00288 family)
MPETGQSLALFCDFENLALGFAGTRKRFEIDKVLERLLTKGKILVKKAYADWTRFGDYRKELHEASIELIEIPKRTQVGKNSADIRLCVDALDLCYSKAHIDTFCILSGDSDFSPLVSKLRENGKHVIGVGMKNSTSNLLVEGCDEFIYYEDIERVVEEAAAAPVVTAASSTDKKAEALQLLIDVAQALKKDGKEVLWSSLVKDTIRRRKPQFDEVYHGFKSWSDLLEEAQRRGLLTLSIDTRSGTYVIAGLGPPPPGTAPSGPPQAREFPRENGGRREHGRDNGRGRFGRGSRGRGLPAGEGRPAEAPPAAPPPGAAPAAPEAVLGVPAAPVEPSEADTAILQTPDAATPQTAPHIPAEEAPAETGAEAPEETPAGGAPTAGESPKKGGVRRRGRARGGARPRGGPRRD